MYRLPTRNASRLPKVAQRKGYRLLKAEPAPQVVQPRRAPMTPFVLPGMAGHGHTPGPQRAPVTRQRFTVNAPANAYKWLATLNLNVASERVLPAFLGTVRLACQPDSVDLERLRAGVVNLCADHSLSTPIGRVKSMSILGGNVTAQAENSRHRRRAQVPCRTGSRLKIRVLAGVRIVDRRARSEGTGLRRSCGTLVPIRIKFSSSRAQSRQPSYRTLYHRGNYHERNHA